MTAGLAPLPAGLAPAVAAAATAGGEPPAPPRIPSLDGLRALSIGAVIAGHLAGTRGVPAALTPLLANPHLGLATLGVRVFFVISGFLITGLLLDERAASGRVSLGRFYVRRGLRIIPAYLAYVLVVMGLVAVGTVEVAPGDFAHALTWTMNYSDTHAWALGHLWSLALEEQFYLLWPVTLVLLGRRGGTWVAVAVVVVAPFLRVAAMVRDLPVHTFGTAADAIAVGCLVALWREPLAASPRLRRVVRAGWLGPALIAAATVVAINFRRTGWLTQDAVTNVGCGLFMLHCVRHPGTRLGRLLNTRAAAFVGALSYSLYLWQQLFIDREQGTWPHAFPFSLALATLAALASYHALERPLLRLRRRWGSARAEAPASPA